MAAHGAEQKHATLSANFCLLPEISHSGTGVGPVGFAPIRPLPSTDPDV